MANHNVTGSAQGGAVVVGAGLGVQLAADDGTKWSYGAGGIGLGGGGFSCDDLTGWLDTDPSAVWGPTTSYLTVTALGDHGRGNIDITFGVSGEVGHVTGTIGSGAIAYTGTNIGGFTQE